MKKTLKIGLLGRIVIAIAAGVGVGWVSPLWVARLCETFSTVFSQVLGFLIPLIIVGFVAPAIAEIGRQAGRLLVVTAALAYGATLLAGMVSYYTGDFLFPDLITADPELLNIEAGGLSIEPYFTVAIPPLMGVMTALALAFMVGIGVAFSEAAALKRGLVELRQIVSLTISGVVIPLLPAYIFCIFTNMTVSGQVVTILSAFIKIIAIIFAVHIFILLLQYSIAGLIARRNPLKMLRTMMPAYFTALGTQSSAATIPVTLRQAIKMGVSDSIAGFVVPLCATIHMSGSTLKIVACALALMIMQGLPYDAGLFFHFIAMLGITIIAAPGIPGGAIMASLGLLTSILGFSDAQNALMIALYIAMDSFGTACNVTGDGALATIVDRWMKPENAPPVAKII
ncbi:MAG: dicarboxylate/amino acid:cation symporter [Bacteroidales bacterium]|nr:dicarboxylate/amino acid:cation symporter [Bacteroidales bacterium]